MLQTTLPGVPQAIEDARAWTRTAVQARFPRVDADVAADVAALLVRSSVAAAEPGQDVLIEVRLTKPRRGSGVVVEVYDPIGKPHSDGLWGTISEQVRSFGAGSSAAGHLSWAELPSARAS